MLKKLQKLFSGSEILSNKFETEDDFPSFVPSGPSDPAGRVVSIDPYRSRFWQDSIEAWMTQLPEELRPVALNQSYPRVAAKLMTHWHQPSAVESYLFDLLVDQRGNRRGFGMTVVHELRRLQGYISRKALPSDRHY